MKKLNGLTIMVTRPKPQGEWLCEAIKAAGGNTVYFPTIEIQPPEDPAALEQGIARLDQYDWLIFISPQCIYQTADLFRQYWPEFPNKVKVAALGGGTADALKQAKLPVDLYPANDWSSEGLLDEPAFHELSGKNIVLIRGESSREFLAEMLTVRGAELTQLIAYRRCLPHVNVNEYLDSLRKGDIDSIVCTSSEILYNLKVLLSAGWAELQHVPVIVVSERTEMLARQLEFNHILLAANASINAIMDILTSQVCQT